MGRESLTQRAPKHELLPLARIVCSLEPTELPLVIVGGSPCVARILGDTRDEPAFDSEMLIRCIRQAYQVVFSMVEVTSIVEYTILRLKTAVYEDWMEERRRSCARVSVKGSWTLWIYGVCCLIWLSCGRLYVLLSNARAILKLKIRLKG